MSLNTNAEAVEAVEAASQVALLKDELNAEASAEAAAEAAEAAKAEVAAAAVAKAEAAAAEAANAAAAHFGLDSKTQQSLDRLSNPKAPGARLKASLRKAALAEATAAKFRTSSSKMPESASPRQGPSMSLDADADAVEAASQVALLKDELNAEASAEAPAAKAAAALTAVPAPAAAPAQKTVGLAPTTQQTIDRLANPRAPRARLQDNLRKAARTETVAAALLQGRAGGPAFRAPPPAGTVPRAPSPG